MNHKQKITFSVVALAIALLNMTIQSLAQGITPVQCGSIVEGEFTQRQETQVYVIDLKPGDKLILDVTAVGQTLKVDIAVTEPSGNGLFSDTSTKRSWSIETPILSGRGKYTIFIANGNIWPNGAPFSGGGGTGIYNLNIGCELRDGTIIKPGDIPQPTQSASVNNSSGNNISNEISNGESLVPDFAGAARLRLTRSGEAEGEFAANNSQPFTIPFEAKADQQYDLTFSRISGNLNLGLVILSEDRKVYALHALVAGSSLTTQIRLPAGTYTIGIFTLNFVPPVSAETTAFAIALK